MNRRGEFAAVTNFRETPPSPLPPRSRGELPVDFLRHHPVPTDYLSAVNERGHAYRGFNLLVAGADGCFYHSNRAGDPRRLDDGAYGLSNQLLDCDWPKVGEGRTRLLQAVEVSGNRDRGLLASALFELLADRGDGREFSMSFISSDVYGTRASTVVIIDREGGIFFEERNFGPEGRPAGRRQFTFNCNGDS